MVPTPNTLLTNVKAIRKHFPYCIPMTIVPVTINIHLQSKPRVPMPLYYCHTITLTSKNHLSYNITFSYDHYYHNLHVKNQPVIPICTLAQMACYVKKEVPTDEVLIYHIHLLYRFI